MERVPSIDEAFETYQAFLNRANYKSAAMYLATTMYCLESLSEGSSDQNLLYDLTAPEKVIEAAKETLSDKLIRIERITSVGSKWDIDEIFLLIQLRLEVGILVYFLDQTCNDFSSPDLRAIDFWFRSVSATKEHEAGFKKALQTIRKNWEIPIQTEWLLI